LIRLSALTAVVVSWLRQPLTALENSQTIKTMSEFSAAVKVLLSSGEEAVAIARAISVDKPPGSRSEVKISTKGDELSLDFSATDAGALRAALNSYLRQIKIASEAISL
jgi:tRNA threonylcarbamoyladenosine modification (KEOPS) complex  Pcc1 subunit